MLAVVEEARRHVIGVFTTQRFETKAEMMERGRVDGLARQLLRFDLP